MSIYKCNNIAIAPGQIWSWTSRSSTDWYYKVCVLDSTDRENNYKCLYLECGPGASAKAGDIGNFAFRHEDDCYKFLGKNKCKKCYK